MNTNKLKHLSLALILTFVLSACSTDPFGGEASISGFIKHHSVIIPSAKVMLKFRAEELPGTNASDYDYITYADSTGAYFIGELKKGKYYLYSAGYDFTISDSVFGGIPVQIGMNGEEVSTDIPVTED